MTDVGQIHVLLVEDNPGDAKLVEHHLREGSVPGLAETLGLTHVGSLDAAVSSVSSDTFDLVLLDLGLPESTGLETLDRFLPEVPGTPVVVLTGLDDTETAVEAIQRGAQDYLPKDDIDADVLTRTIRYAIERKKQELALRRQTEQMKFFNSVLRHDVGNGMNVIRSNARLLAEDLDGENGDRAETIVSWSDDMIDLTNKIRRMLEAVTDDGEPTRGTVDLSEILRSRLDQVASLDDVRVNRSIPDNVVVQAGDMLPEVLGNVLTNAVEHNDADEPRLTVDVEDGEESVTVRIADNGPGIPDERKERIFGRGESRSESGGFGLYFVATMVDSYGGEVTVEDNDAATGARGSVFRITLPAP